MGAGAMLVALALEAAFGWPDAIHRRIGHPVTWTGALIARLDAAWNDEGAHPDVRRARGVAAVVIVVLAAVLPAALIADLVPPGPVGTVLTGILAAPLLATRSLRDHVAAVARPLGAGDVEAARAAVARIVGRDPAMLDAPGIARAAMESLGENASDGVVAPLFWGALLGLPGIAAYKAINTLDSMIGYRTPRHESFGWAAARLDDAANRLPARLTALAFALASGRPRAAWAVARRDAGHHRSPNAGWPEAALAAGVGVRLSGPRIYAGRTEHHPWVNESAPDPDAAALRRGLALYARAVALCALPLVPLALL